MSYLDKLAKIEALLQRASSDGERQAAALAKERILEKISDVHKSRPIRAASIAMLAARLSPSKPKAFRLR